MNHLDPIDILLVEDNPHDGELTIRALKKCNLANHLYVVEDGRKPWISSLAGANTYVVKPVEFNAFTEAMSHVGFYWLLMNQSPKWKRTY